MVPTRAHMILPPDHQAPMILTPCLCGSNAVPCAPSVHMPLWSYHICLFGTTAVSTCPYVSITMPLCPYYVFLCGAITMAYHPITYVPMSLSLWPYGPFTHALWSYHHGPITYTPMALWPYHLYPSLCRRINLTLR